MLSAQLQGGRDRPRMRRNGGRRGDRPGRMHVLVIPSWYPTAENPVRGIFFREQSHAVRRAGHDVGVIAVEAHGRRRAFDALRGVVPLGIRTEVDAGIPTYRAHVIGWRYRLPYGASGTWARAIDALYRRYVERHGRPDLVHVHSALYAGAAALRLKRRYGVPYVITEHSTAYARGLLRRWELRLCRRIFAAADARIFVSPMQGEQVGSLVGRAVEPWEWVPNMVDARFEPAPARERGRTARPFRFLNVAILTAKKGHVDLLDAFARAFPDAVGVELRIGGDGPERSRLEAHAAALGIADHVRWLGRLTRDQVLAELREADAFVLPSHYETFGVVLIEALACGLPVVATACGGPECIVHERNGVLVPPRSVDALARAMAAIHRGIGEFDPEFIRSDCLARFGEHAVVDRITAVYERVLGMRAGRPAAAV